MQPPTTGAGTGRRNLALPVDGMPAVVRRQAARILGVAESRSLVRSVLLNLQGTHLV